MSEFAPLAIVTAFVFALIIAEIRTWAKRRLPALQIAHVALLRRKRLS